MDLSILHSQRERPVDQRPVHGRGDNDKYEPGTVETILGLTETIRHFHKGVISLKAVAEQGADPKPLTDISETGAPSQSVSFSAGRIAGLSLREVSGTATALVRFHDGKDANADLVDEVALLANESIRDWYLPGGKSFSNGLFVEVVSGSVSGVVFLGPPPRDGGP